MALPDDTGTCYICGEEPSTRYGWWWIGGICNANICVNAFTTHTNINVLLLDDSRYENYLSHTTKCFKDIWQAGSR